MSLRTMRQPPYPTLANPPIVEMIIELHCSIMPDSNITSAEIKLVEGVREEYTKKSILQSIEHSFSSPEGKPSEHEVHNQIHGYRFATDDNSKFIQYRDNGFSFNKLAPYTNLDDYINEISKYWNLYREHVKVSTVKELSMRFINKIEIPILDEPVSLTDYFYDLPSQYPGIADQFGGIFQSFKISNSETQTLGQVTIATQEIMLDKWEVIVDIDVRKPLNKDECSFEELQQDLNDLRILKNSIFFNTLTPLCLNLYPQ